MPKYTCEDYLRNATEHFLVPLIETVERFKFQNSLRKHGEAIADFVRVIILHNIAFSNVGYPIFAILVILGAST